MVFQIHGGRKIPYSFGRIWCSLVVHSLIAEHLRMEIEVVRRGDTCYSANKASAGDDLSMLEGNIMPCSHGRRGGEMRAMCSDDVVCSLGWL
jgi:hypothetical protein